MDTGLTEIDLSGFTGHDPARYGSFVYEALEQAGDLFELATGLIALPVSGLASRVARRGVLAMAEALFEGNAYREARFSPFRSETIGSYTYSLAEGSVLAGIPTGISWFDLAVDRLKVIAETVSSRSISAFDRPGDVQQLEGRWILTGPADSDSFTQGPRDSGFGGSLA